MNVLFKIVSDYSFDIQFVLITLISVTKLRPLGQNFQTNFNDVNKPKMFMKTSGSGSFPETNKLISTIGFHINYRIKPFS